MRIKLVFFILFGLFFIQTKAQLGMNYHFKEENNFLKIKKTKLITPELSFNEATNNRTKEVDIRIGISPVAFREVINPIDKVIHYGIGADFWINNDETYAISMYATYIFPLTIEKPSSKITTSNILIGLNYIKFVDNTLDDDFSPYALSGFVYNKAFQSTQTNTNTISKDKNYIMFDLGIGAHLKVNKMLLIFEGKINFLLTDIPVVDMFSIGPSFFCIKTGLMIPIGN